MRKLLRGRTSQITNPSASVKGGVLTLRMSKEDHMRIATVTQLKGMSINGFCLGVILNEVSTLEQQQQQSPTTASFNES